MDDDRTTVEASRRKPPAARIDQLALVVAWSRDEPHRVGEIAFLAPGAQVLGRGGARPEDGIPRVGFFRRRPGQSQPAIPLQSVRISRLQLRLEAAADSGQVRVESVGRCPVLCNGARIVNGVARPGDTLQLQRELVLVLVRRPRAMADWLEGRTYPAFEFGGPDAFGIVGESDGAWRLREGLAFAGASHEHVLLSGESGVGKELAARAVHALSPRRDRAFVARNAATVPEGLVDAELFGNVKNYPNPGMPEREGIIGLSHGATLFLDEIGELPAHLQAHLLRVLDRDGEYQRLGDSRMRRADLRVIAATNRPLEALKHDFAARFTLRIHVPSLAERIEDVPLLVTHLLLGIARQNEQVARRFFASGRGDVAAPRIDPDLIEALVRRTYQTHLRELQGLLWQAIQESQGDSVELPQAVRGTTDGERPSSASPADTPVSREQIAAALARNAGNITRAARELGFKNRFAFYRAMRKLGLDVDAT